MNNFKYNRETIIYDDVDYDSLMKTLTYKFNDKYDTVDVNLCLHRGDPDTFSKREQKAFSKIEEYVDNGYHIEHLKIGSTGIFTRGVAKCYDEMDVGVIAIPKEDLDNLDEILEDIDKFLMLINDCGHEINFYRVAIKDTASDEVYDEYIANIRPEYGTLKVTKI